MRNTYFLKYALANTRWISVDPGTQGIGIAVWDGNRLAHSNSYSGRQSDNWLERSLSAVSKMHVPSSSEIYRGIDYLFFELPFTANNASTAKQDVVKLCISAGIVINKFYSLNRTLPVPIPVQEWKGQLKKQESTRRIKNMMAEVMPDYQTTTKADHELDAIGLGLHIIGRGI